MIKAIKVPPLSRNRKLKMGMTDTTIMIVITRRVAPTIIGIMKIITKIDETIDPSSPKCNRDSTMTMNGSTMLMIWRKLETKIYSDQRAETDAPRRKVIRLVFPYFYSLWRHFYVMT